MEMSRLLVSKVRVEHLVKPGRFQIMIPFVSISWLQATVTNSGTRLHPPHNVEKAQ